MSSGKPRRKPQGKGILTEDTPWGEEGRRSQWSVWDFMKSPKLTLVPMDLEPQGRMREKEEGGLQCLQKVERVCLRHLGPHELFLDSSCFVFSV